MAAIARDLVKNVSSALTTEAVSDFESKGYCSMMLPEAQAQPWSQAVSRCYESQLMSPNKVQFTASAAAKPIVITKPNIFEADMHDASVRKRLPEFDALFEDEMSPLIKILNAKLPSLMLAGEGDPQTATQSITLKLQVNTGGAFPWHYDNPGPPNKRKLTLALYLADEWEESHGGELILLPFLGKQVVVPPKLGTLVLFRSDSVMHRVLTRNLKAEGYRRCFTIWFDAIPEAVNPDGEVNLRAKHLTEAFIPEMLTSPIQRSLSRAVYDDIYRTALYDCFGGKDTQESKISIAIHEAHLKPLKQSEAVMKFVELLRIKVQEAHDAS